jgi:hypothetical protein
MKTTKAFIASFGTSVLLVGSSVTMLAVVSAVLAFRGIPGPRADTPAQTVVVRAAEASQDEIQLTRDDIDAATEPSRDDQAPPASGGSPSGAGDSQPASDSGTTSSNTGGPGSSSPPSDAPGDNENNGDRNLRDQIDELPNRVRDTVNGIDLGKNGRDATRALSDGVVSKLNPKLGEAVKKTTEPVWEILDRDP